MPDRELVLREKCPCGEGPTSFACTKTPLPTAISNEGWCPGGSETVLDPERVVFRAWDSHNQQYSITVQDMLDALGGSR